MRKLALLSLPVLGAVALFALSQSAQAAPGYFNSDGYYFCQGSASDCQQHKEQVMAVCGAQGGDQQACRASGGSGGGSSSGSLDRRATDGRGMNSDSAAPQSSGSPGYFNSDGYYVCQSSEEACQQHKDQIMASCGAEGGDQQACRQQRSDQRVNEIADKYNLPGVTPSSPSIANEESLQAGFQKEYNGVKEDSQRCSILKHAQASGVAIDTNQNPFEQGDESQCSNQGGSSQQTSTSQAAPTPAYTKTQPKPSSSSTQSTQSSQSSGTSSSGSSSSNGSSQSTKKPGMTVIKDKYGNISCYDKNNFETTCPEDVETLFE